VYALYRLGGAIDRVHTEDIALEAHKLFPDSFSWTRHPKFPDKDIVRVALTDARKEKYGRLIDGRTGQYKGQTIKTSRKREADGWVLTEEGVSWVKENQARFENSNKFPKAHRQKVMKEADRIRRHKLFADFLREPDHFEPDFGLMAELFRCRVDAQEVVWIKRFDTARRNASLAEGQDVVVFVDACELSFRNQK
jgi:hypothetical protein